MKKRLWLALTVATLGLVGLAGCDTTGTSTADLTPEGQALAALGVNPADLAVAPSTESSTESSTGSSTAPSTAPNAKHPRLRMKLRKNVLHGEATVQTKDGVKTIAVQRGTVTAITGTSVTVKSTDGFTQTWTFGPNLSVIEHRATVQPSAVKAGAEIGVAGPHEGSTYTARLIVLT
jgi:hypothetical protein